LQTALDEALKARQALLAADRQRADADVAAAQAKASVAAALAERNAAAAREDELRQAQQKLLAEAATTQQSSSERAAATADLESKLAAIAEEASRRPRCTSCRRGQAESRRADRSRSAGECCEGGKNRCKSGPDDTGIASLSRDRYGQRDAAGVLFGPLDRQRIEALADKHRFNALPPLEFFVPDKSVDHAYRRFVGIWVDETGDLKTGKGRRNAILIFRVESDGRVAGVQLFGPADATSFDQGPLAR